MSSVCAGQKMLGEAQKLRSGGREAGVTERWHRCIVGFVA
jgi:hypothetical protein